MPIKKSQSSVVRLLTELLVNDGKDGRKPLSSKERLNAILKIDQERARLREARKHRRKYKPEGEQNAAPTHLPGQKFKGPSTTNETARIAREESAKSKFFDTLATPEVKE